MEIAVNQPAALDDQEVILLLKRAFLYAKGPAHAETSQHITLDSSIEDLGIDSIAALEMSGFIEEQIDVQFPDDELVAIRSMRDLAHLVRKYNRR